MLALFNAQHFNSKERYKSGYCKQTTLNNEHKHESERHSIWNPNAVHMATKQSKVTTNGNLTVEISTFSGV